MLIIVKDRDMHAFAQLALDIKTFRGLDVFQVDAAKGRFQRGDDLHQFDRVVLGDLDIEHIDAGKLLEQHRLAFHDRLRRQGADVAQAQHCGSIADDGHQVTASGKLTHRRGVFVHQLAGRRHAGRVGQSQVLLGGQRFGGRNLDLSRLGEAMVMQCAFFNVVTHLALFMNWN